MLSLSVGQAVFPADGANADGSPCCRHLSAHQAPLRPLRTRGQNGINAVEKRIVLSAAISRIIDPGVSALQFQGEFGPRRFLFELGHSARRFLTKMRSGAF
jgi:hypothetical protein